MRVRFSGVAVGRWTVDSQTCVAGDQLPAAPCLEVIEGEGESAQPALWTLRGVVSNERYVERRERTQLVDVQEAVGRVEASCAALIPIRKSPAWWALTQDERRAIFEGRSKHIAVSLPYLPRIARRLHHSRDLGEPYDFLTWFDFAPQDAGAFDELAGRLRETEEWEYVEAEVDIRLSR